MAAVRTFTLPHYEAYPVQIALFKHVKNAEYLRSQLLAANSDFDYAFLDAAMVSIVHHPSYSLSLHRTIDPMHMPSDDLFVS
jgi:EKC/KEOPS complex subunit CGI121/TPRKB